MIQDARFTRLVREVIDPIGLFNSSGVGICQWIDDTLLYARDEDEYLRALESFLQQIRHKGLRLSVEKRTFLTRRASFCGREICSDGWNFSSHFYDKIINAPRPTYTYELAQMLYVATWLGTQIPNLVHCAINSRML